jgi:4-hydroxy-tetrahydrodipicolinate reductase
MNIALVGYGKMGKAIKQIALQRKHAIVSVIDIDNRDDFASDAFKSADVAIEFTAPEAAVDNYKRCFAAGVPVVSGTTGWLARLPEIKRMCDTGQCTFFYASNFSIGVNIFFALNNYLAKMMDGFLSYDASLTETHHIHKKDAPSGTAITLAENILANLSRKSRWRLGEAAQLDDLAVYALREGETPGIHEVTYESEADYISIRHCAKSRAGFALGAVMAAEFTAGKKGFLGMSDMLRLDRLLKTFD